MKSRKTRVASLILAASLLLSSSAFAREDPRNKPIRPIDKIVKIIKKIFTAIPHDDYPVPPKP